MVVRDYIFNKRRKLLALFSLGFIGKAIMPARQLKEVSEVKQANRLLKKRWKLLRCLLQQAKRGEAMLYVLISP